MPTLDGRSLGSSNTVSATARTGARRPSRRRKNTSVTGMVEAGILASRSVERSALLSPTELASDWDPRHR